MPSVDAQHPLFKEFATTWRTVRDCVMGPRAIKAAGETYLPGFHKMRPLQYEAYKKRAKFFNATKRTLQAFIGMIFNKNPDWKLPATVQMKDLTSDATMTGKSLYDWAKDTVGVVSSVGRRGTLIDWAPEPEDRVYFAVYEAHNILNWSYRRVAGRLVLSLLVLRETSTEWIPDAVGEQRPDPFEPAEYEQWRVIRLIDSFGEPFVQVDVYRRSGASKGAGGSGPADSGFKIIEQKQPERRGRLLHRIPFVFHGPTGGDPDPDTVPMEDIAEVNLSHYRLSADLANARRAAGVPTPYIFGLSSKEVEKEIHLGTSEALVSTNKDATCGFMSYGGEGLASLEKGLEEDERQMAALGASMLDRQGGAAGKNAEAYETVQLRFAGTSSALMTIVIACSQTLSDALQWAVWWQKGVAAEDPEDLEGEVGVELSTEFLKMVMDSGMLGELMQSYLQGGISYETLFWNLQRGGIIPSEKKIEDEKREIESSPVGLPGAADKTGMEEPPPSKKKPKKQPAGG